MISKIEIPLVKLLLIGLTLVWFKLFWDLVVWHNPVDWYHFSYIKPKMVALGFVALCISALMFSRVFCRVERQIIISKELLLIMVPLVLGSILGCLVVGSSLKVVQFAIALLGIAYFMFKVNTPAKSFFIIAGVFVLLIPSDNCWNPPNAWWVQMLGYSPLQFLLLSSGAVLLLTKPQKLTKNILTIFSYGYMGLCLFHLYSGSW